MELSQMLAMVDHTLLKPESTWAQIKAICDDAMAWAARKGTGAWSMTANMSVRFIRSVLVGHPYEVRGELARQDGKKFHTQAVIRDAEGKPCVEAKAVFVEVPADKLFDR